MREPIVVEIEQFVEEVLERLIAVEDGLDELSERLETIEKATGLVKSLDDAPDTGGREA